jgi:signal transduction histidine kinase
MNDHPVNDISGDIKYEKEMFIMENGSPENTNGFKKKLIPIVQEIITKRPTIFAFALVHEIRNPLNNIKLAAEMLVSGSLSEEQKELVDVILRGSGRIQDLVTDYLVANKDTENHSEPFSINELLDEVLLENNDQAKLRKVHIIKDYAVRNGNLLGNKKEIKIALSNIIINAIEAMPAEHGILKLGTRLNGDKYIVEIEDNGVGISKQNLQKIFDPYFTNKPGGLGLGLTATMDILASNCGTIEVKSEVGAGTRFTLSFNKNSVA